MFINCLYLLGLGWLSFFYFLRSARPTEAAIAKVFAKVFAKICQTNLILRIFSDAQNARGRPELRVVKISALNDRWWYKKRQKHEKTKNRNFFLVSKISFSSLLIDFEGTTAKRTSKSDSASNFAPDTAFLRSVQLKIVQKQYSWPML